MGYLYDDKRNNQNKNIEKNFCSFFYIRFGDEKIKNKMNWVDWIQKQKIATNIGWVISCYSRVTVYVHHKN